MTLRSFFDVYKGILLDTNFLILFTSFFSLGFLYFYKAKRIGVLKKRQIGNSLLFHAEQLVKIVFFSLGLSLLATYLQMNWLSPLLMMTSNPTSDTLKIILTFIAIMFSFLMALSVYGYNLIQNHYVKMFTQEILEVEDELASWKNRAISNENRISFLVNFLSDTLKKGIGDEKAIIRMRFYSDLLPLFDDNEDKFEGYDKLTGALQILKLTPEARDIMDATNWAYIKNTLAPKYKGDQKLYSLICEVLKGK